MDDVRARIRSFISDNFYLSGPLVDDASLLDEGVIDSTGVLEVIAFLEREFSIAVEDAEMLPENLDSVERIEAFVRRKTERVG